MEVKSGVNLCSCTDVAQDLEAAQLQAAMPGPVLPKDAVRGDSPCKSPTRGVPRYRSAMLDCSPKSQKSHRSQKSNEAKQTRRQRTAMLLADGTPKAKVTGMEHQRTAMLMASKSMNEDDGTQSSSSLMSFMQGKVKGLVESVRHRN